MDKMTILCIDDENIVLRSIKNELLYIFGGTYLVEAAESGQEAFDILQELTTDGMETPVVICDYIMPGMKGDEVLEKIHIKYPDIITVMLTGRAVTQGVINAVNNASLFRYIEKPWTRDELESAVIKAVELYLANKKSNEQRVNLLDKKKQLDSEIIRKRNELLAVKERLNTGNISTNLNSFYQYLKLINEIRDSFDIGNLALLHHSSDCRSGAKENQLNSLISQLPDSAEINRILSNIEKAKSQDLSEKGLASLQDMNVYIEKIFKQIGEILNMDI